MDHEPCCAQAHQPCCEYRTERDPFAVIEQYLVRCLHHDGDTVHTWRPGDEPYRCSNDYRR